NSDAVIFVKAMGETVVTSTTETITSEETITVETTTVLTYPADVVVDFAAQNLEVLTGPSTTITIDIDGQRGNLISASGTLNINLYNFFQLSGNFAFEKYESQVTLSDGSVKQIDLLTLGGENINAFVGMNGGQSDQLGFELTGVDFALALMTDKTESSLKWTSLQATAATAGFVGLGGDFTITSSDLAIEINQADKNGLVVDHLSDAMAVKISNDNTIDLDMDGSRLQLLSVSGNLDINVFNFFQVSGGFALNKYTETIKLSDGSEVVVDLMTLGASGVDAFVGMNGGTDDQIGFEVTDTDFALSILKEKDGAKRKWTSLYSTIGGAAFVGVEGLTIEASDLVVEINKKAADATVVDFKSKTLEIETSSSTSLTLDFDGAKSEYIRVRGNLNINLFNFFSVNGGFALSKQQEIVTLSDNSTATVDLLTLGGNNVNAFVGLNGGSADALGFELLGVDFALALMTDQNNTARKWTSLYAAANSASF
ncbi:hypothetical protein MJH12_16645, partial [bacterium]|nr:hypothetical protein [bacterium]